MSRPGPIGTVGHEPEWDTVVVGAGLGGLSTAAFLARNGQRVLVLERNPEVGGSAQTFHRAGGAYRFDVGVHLVGECEPGGRMRTLTAALGIDHQVEWCQLDPDGFSTITLPGVQFRVPVGWEAYTERLVETFGDEEAGLRRCVGVLRAVAAELREPEPGRLAAARRLLGRPGWSERPLAQLFDDCGLSPEARAVVAGESGAYAAPPSRTPVGVHAALLDHHLVSGTWYPRGGGQVLPTLLARTVEAHGGEVHVGVPVDRVMVEGGRAVGVTLEDGTEVHARAVVSNADPRRTYLGLVGREHLPPRLLRRVEAMRPALPLVTVHLALDVDLGERLPNSSLWIHPQADLEAPYAAAYEGRTSAQVPVLLTSATVKDPTGTPTAPAGRSTLALVAVAPARPSTWHLKAGGPVAGERYSSDPGYLATKEEVTEALIETASQVIGDLRQHVVHCETSTPVTHERFTHATGGTAYGLEVAPGRASRSRAEVRTPLPGLFLTGAGTRYLPGVLSAMQGGAETAEAVLAAVRRG